ncbi:hypothetical protein [Streptomyces sp. NBC_00385]|uniref:hypothetical protein n=1 Tax=Streptomyces sp. NBC_00385 TaxID=2975733 RepID=UPI002DD984DC|nr:hypothetical protein [Streptomyces sp. NBC_00385]WRZ05805.1 hypothetical protein OG959_21910 [Streptomyces sp. NBC_00385]
MLTVEAVLEAVPTVNAASWPAAALPHHTFLTLTGRMSECEVGAAMALLTDWFATEADGSGCVPDAAERVRRLIATDRLVAAGGLRVRDARTGVTVTPGCCCGLEDWREWLRLPDGVHVHLGHDPTPRAEFEGRAVLMWPDGGDGDEERPEGRPIRLPLADLPGLLRAVRADLEGFLDLVGRWAGRYVPSQAADLVAKLDADLEIRPPLTIP